MLAIASEESETTFRDEFWPDNVQSEKLRPHLAIDMRYKIERKGVAQNIAPKPNHCQRKLLHAVSFSWPKRYRAHVPTAQGLRLDRNPMQPLRCCLPLDKSPNPN